MLQQLNVVGDSGTQNPHLW